jgi:type I restriction enzyme R subunit
LHPPIKVVNDLESEEDEAHFVQAFRKLMRAMNVLQSYTDFDWEDLLLMSRNLKTIKAST